MKRLILLSLVFSISGLTAQVKSFDPSSEEKYSHRFRLSLATGFSSVIPAFLDESATSWVQNSFFYSTINPDSPIVFSPYKPKAAKMNNFNWDVSYNYNHFLELSFSQFQLMYSTNSSGEATATFFNPGNSTYAWSLFEGARLLQYFSKSNIGKIFFLFRIPKPRYRWIRIGPSIANEIYSEKNIVSIGSYTIRNPLDPINPTLRTWNSGGESSIIYNLKGIYPGLISRFFLFPWLHVNFEIYRINRKGNFNFTGLQIIQKRKDNDPNYLEFAFSVPTYYGNPTDRGIKTILEGEFKICRFSLIVGYLREELKRKYTSYQGTTMGDIENIILKTPIIGMGEILNQHSYINNQIYLKFIIGFYFR